MKNLLYYGQIPTFVVRRRKRPAGTPFVKWALAHKHAFIVNDPELKAQLTTYID